MNVDYDQPLYIYGLIDPRTEEIRYIGVTNNLTRRIREHKGDISHTHKSYWIQELQREGLIPIIVTLEMTSSHKDWEEVERRWIAYGREQGWPLTNLTDGGEGMHGYTHPPAVRAKLSNYPRTKEWKARMSKAATGKIKSKEHRRNLGIAQLGRKHTEEHRRKNALAQLGNEHNIMTYPDMYNTKTGEHISAGKNLSKLCRDRGLRYQAMWGLIHGNVPKTRDGWVKESDDRILHI